MISATNSTRNSTAAAAQTPTATQPGGAMGKDQFLKLLIAQMQNQDPMSPMQGDQMAAQLAQFSSLEQLQQINSNLTGQASAATGLLGAVQSSAAINTIGHTVVATGDQVQIGGTSGSTTVTAELGARASTATLHILDANGKEVGKRELGALSAGRQTFDIGSAGDGLADGTYTFSIDAKDASGGTVTAQTFVRGRVDGISAGQTGIVLNVGAIAIPYNNVVQVLN